jgi:hypothetical protein
MDQRYDDYTTGLFIPEITITKREDNGHFVATSMGITATHHDQSVAVNKVSAAVQDAIQRGDIYPGM